MANPEQRASIEDPKKPKTFWTRPKLDSITTYREHFTELGMHREPMFVLISTEDPEPYHFKRDLAAAALYRHVLDAQAGADTQLRRMVMLDFSAVPLAIADIPSVPDKTLYAAYSNRLVLYKNGESTSNADFFNLANYILGLANVAIEQNNKDVNRSFYTEPFPQLEIRGQVPAVDLTR